MFKFREAIVATATAALLFGGGMSTAAADDAPLETLEQTTQSVVLAETVDPEPALEPANVADEPVSEPAAAAADEDSTSTNTEEVAAPAPAAPEPAAPVADEEPVATVPDTAPATTPATTTEDRAPPASEPLVTAVADSDEDGVGDDIDKCPGTPAGYPVDADGCAAWQLVVAPTTDDVCGPGGAYTLPALPAGYRWVVDGVELTPGTYSTLKSSIVAVATHNAVGDWDQSFTLVFTDVPCTPLDGDNDGVNDFGDKCPGTPAGETVNADGCSNSQLDGDRLCRNDKAKGWGACFGTHRGLLKGKAHGIADPYKWIKPSKPHGLIKHNLVAAHFKSSGVCGRPLLNRIR